jgi:hypothetical protein
MLLPQVIPIIYGGVCHAQTTDSQTPDVSALILKYILNPSKPRQNFESGYILLKLWPYQIINELIQND